MSPEQVAPALADPNAVLSSGVADIQLMYLGPATSVISWNIRYVLVLPFFVVFAEFCYVYHFFASSYILSSDSFWLTPQRFISTGLLPSELAVLPFKF